jgi:hypothetical protein
MTHEKYLVAGVARNSAGQLKARYSTLSVSDTEVRQAKAGNTDILYVDLPRPMTRDEIPAYLLTLEQFKSVAAYREVLEDANTNHALKSKTPRTKAPQSAKTAKSPKVKAAKPAKVRPAVKAPPAVDTDLEIEELKAIAA